MLIVEKFDRKQGEKFRELMDTAGCQVLELAAACGVSDRTVKRWRQGHKISEAYISQVCGYLEVDLSFFNSELTSCKNGKDEYLDGLYEEVISRMRSLSPVKQVEMLAWIADKTGKAAPIESIS